MVKLTGGKSGRGGGMPQLHCMANRQHNLTSCLHHLVDDEMGDA